VRSKKNKQERRIIGKEGKRKLNEKGAIKSSQNSETGSRINGERGEKYCEKRRRGANLHKRGIKPCNMIGIFITGPRGAKKTAKRDRGQGGPDRFMQRKEQQVKDCL